MKIIFILFLNVFFLSNIYSQAICNLSLNEEKLIGTCENSYFTNFEIDLDNTQFDSVNIFEQAPLHGTVTIDNNYKLDVDYVITNRSGLPQLLVETKAGWFTLDDLTFSETGISFVIDHDPDVPVTQVDLDIIKRAKELIQEEKYWHKQDDRKCDDDAENNCYSLFCALKIASVELEGNYNHRNAIMQKIRHSIADLYPNKEWNHRLMDFNNMSETDYKGLISLLNQVEKEVREELERE